MAIGYRARVVTSIAIVVTLPVPAAATGSSFIFADNRKATVEGNQPVSQDMFCFLQIPRIR